MTDETDTHAQTVTTDGNGDGDGDDDGPDGLTYTELLDSDTLPTRERLARAYFEKNAPQTEIAEYLNLTTNSEVSRLLRAYGLATGGTEYGRNWVLARLPYAWAHDLRAEYNIDAVPKDERYDAVVDPDDLAHSDAITRRVKESLLPDMPEEYLVVADRRAVTTARDRGLDPLDVYHAAHDYEIPETFPDEGVYHSALHGMAFNNVTGFEKIVAFLLTVMDTEGFDHGAATAITPAEGAEEAWTTEEVAHFFPEYTEGTVGGRLSSAETAGLAVSSRRSGERARYTLTREGMRVLVGDLAWDETTEHIKLAADEDSPIPAVDPLDRIAASVTDAESEPESDADQIRGMTHSAMTTDTEMDADNDGYEESTAVDDAQTDFRVLPDSATKSDVVTGEKYWARVNNTKPYGVFVSLNNVYNHSDVNGLIHRSRLLLHSPDEFTPYSDEVVVEAVSRKRDGNLDFRLIEWLTNDDANTPSGVSRSGTADATDDDADDLSTDDGLGIDADYADYASGGGDGGTGAGAVGADPEPASVRSVPNGGDTEAESSTEPTQAARAPAEDEGGTEVVSVPRETFDRVCADVRDDISLAPEGSELYWLARGKERALRRVADAADIDYPEPDADGDD